MTKRISELHVKYYDRKSVMRFTLTFSCKLKRAKTVLFEINEC